MESMTVHSLKEWAGFKSRQRFQKNKNKIESPITHGLYELPGGREKTIVEEVNESPRLETVVGTSIQKFFETFPSLGVGLIFLLSKVLNCPLRNSREVERVVLA